MLYASRITGFNVVPGISDDMMMMAEESDVLSTTYFFPTNPSLSLSLLPGEKARLQDISEI